MLGETEPAITFQEQIGFFTGIGCNIKLFPKHVFFAEKPFEQKYRRVSKLREETGTRRF
jgi:hypothetical protein